jgi:FkbM family methyltransferase
VSWQCRLLARGTRWYTAGMGPWLVTGIRTLCRALQTGRDHVPWWQRAALFSIAVHLYAITAPVLWLLYRTVGLPRIEVAALSGARFSCDVADIIDGYIAFFGVWEPSTSAWLTRTLEPGDTFIDVGANVGHHTLLAWRRVGDHGRVVAIEPSPSIHRDLQRNLALNGSPASIEVIQAAVTAKRCEVSLFRGDGWNRGRSSIAHDMGHGVESTVPGRPLAELVGEDDLSRARVLKFDVEGAEHAILTALARDLDALRSDVAILVEVSPRMWRDGAEPGELLRPFLDAGFTAYTLHNPYGLWHGLWPRDVRAPRPLADPMQLRSRQVDLVLTRRGHETG